MDTLDPSVIRQVSERLGRYAYVLIDPRDGCPFYVGKGQGLRMLSHGEEAAAAAQLDGSFAVEEPDTPDREAVGRKVERIRNIVESGAASGPEIWILRYGLGPEYTQVEAAAIDLLLSFLLSRRSRESRAGLRWPPPIN
jgi:hypothetical protein